MTAQRAQIVLDQPDLFSVGKMHVRQFLEHLCVIGGGVAVGDLDAAPALERRMNVPRVIFDPVVSLSNLLVLKTIPQGAATQCYVATNRALAAVSGEYFADCNIAKPRADAEDPLLARRLWDVSRENRSGSMTWPRRSVEG